MEKIVQSLFVAILLSSNSHSQPLNSFTAAFNSLYSELSINYAFTDLKNVNWNKLYDEFRLRVIDVKANNDSSGFIMALDVESFSFPDSWEK